MQKAREAAANVAASAKSGMEKTKATLEEKGEKMTTSDPVRREMAEQKKEGRFQEAELEKQEIRDRNAPGRRADDYGYTTGAIGSQYPVGTDTGSGRTGVLDPHRDEDPLRDRDDRAGVRDPRVGGGTRTGCGTGSTY